MSSMEHNSSEKKRRALRIAISILVAVTLWLYVDYQKHPNVTMTFRDVPVEFSGEDTTLADKGYMLLSCENTTIDIRLKGSRSVISDLDRSSLRVVADTSSITETGTKTLSYQVYYPDSVSRNNVSVEWASAYTIPCRSESSRGRRFPSAASLRARSPRAIPRATRCLTRRCSSCEASATIWPR